MGRVFWKGCQSSTPIWPCETVYAHLARLDVKGDYITSGDVIGSMGSSGRSDGAHLHYEIGVNNESKNPKQFFDVGQSLLSPSSLWSSVFKI